MLSALAGENLVNVLSSPSVMVLDNQKAQIQVGQQVPVATTQQQSTLTANANLINQIEYKDTGVQLSVKPRVTPGGLVQMEIEQEVSTVAATTSSSLNSPTFTTRNITSTVAVRSSQAVVLGGLIQDVRTGENKGSPGSTIYPTWAPFSASARKSSDRTELVVVLTPKVVANDQDIETVSKDFQRRLRGLEFRL